METKQRTQLAARHQSLVTSNIQPAGVSNTDKLQHCHQRVCTGAMRVGMAQLDISLFIHVISIGKTYPLWFDGHRTPFYTRVARITGCIWHMDLAYRHVVSSNFLGASSSGAILYHLWQLERGWRFQVKIWRMALRLFDQMFERRLKQDWFGDGDDTIVAV